MDCFQTAGKRCRRSVDGNAGRERTNGFVAMIWIEQRLIEWSAADRLLYPTIALMYLRKLIIKGMEAMTDDTNVFHLALKDFKRSVEITRDVRFQANLRLAARQRNSSYMISLLSLFVISLSLLPNIIVLQRYQSQILLACSVVLSVFVIFTSLIDGSQNFYHQGELLHQCARKAASVHHELKNIDPDENEAGAKGRLTELQVEYRKALDECPINHENIDFIREQAYKPHLFPMNFSKHESIRKIQIIFKQTHAFFGLHLWMAIHLIAIIAICVIVYNFVLVEIVVVR